MKVAEVLRLVADELPAFEANRSGPSPYICDTLDSLCVDGEFVDTGPTQAFLSELGMGCDLGVFAWRPGRNTYTSYTLADRLDQINRKWWLHFAADLADEWGV